MLSSLAAKFSNRASASDPAAVDDDEDSEVAEEPGTDDVCGWWYWGHADSADHPPSSLQLNSMKLSLQTAPLKLSRDPAFYQDFAKYVLCPHYLDRQAEGTAPGTGCPFLGGKAFLRQPDVKKRLEEVPKRLAAGEIERKNELGYLLLSPATFPLTGSIGLGNDLETHRKQRRCIEDVLSPSKLPNRQGWQEEAALFLAECQKKRKFKVRSSVTKWWFQMLFKHVLGDALSTSDAADFTKFQMAWLQGAVLSGPNAFVEKFANFGSVTEAVWPVSKIIQAQEQWRHRIKKKLPASVPEVDRDVAAQGILEMFVFAGGLSVPLTIHCALAVLYRRDLMPSPVKITEANVDVFVYEVMRLFPAVQGFCYWEKGERQVLSLNAALRDPGVWGPDAAKFTLKDLDLYKQHFVGFANGASTSDGSFDSKACPGMQMSLDVVQGFVLATCRWQPTTTRAHVYWAPKQVPKPQGVHKKWFADFELMIQDWLDGDQTGEALLEELQPVELARLLQEIGQADNQESKLAALLGPSKDRDNASRLGACNLNTKVFYELSRKRFKELSARSASLKPDVSKPGPASRYFDLHFAGGSPVIRLPVQDSMKKMVRDSIAAKIGDVLKDKIDDNLDPMMFVDNHLHRCAAIMLCQEAFAKSEGEKPPPHSNARSDSYLPKPHATFKDITTDESQVAIARCGMGQLYLQSNTYDHLKDFGEFVCDMSVLGSFKVRPAFERLGATAVFKAETNGSWKLTAIDWKHGDKVVKPGESEWEHAKWVWRCSLITHMTAVHHLVQAHWLVANALSATWRETMRPFHPVRRLLQVITYNTTSINHNSALSLFPNGGMLHRMSPYPYEELQKVFTAAAEGWKFRTWPEEYASVDLPESVKSKLPIYQDGLEVYEVMHEFVKSYIDLYYPDDESVTSCPDLNAYWKFPCVPQYARSLPPLSKKALIDQLTRGMFDVTGYHEFVGYVVAYTTDPAGACLQVRPGRNMCDLQELLAVNSLVAGTGTPMPMFVPSGEPGDEDWLHQLDLTSDGGFPASKFETVSKHYENMMSKLKQISKTVEQRNAPGAGRDMPCVAMDPLTFERSVSL